MNLSITYVQIELNKYMLLLVWSSDIYVYVRAAVHLNFLRVSEVSLKWETSFLLWERTFRPVLNDKERFVSYVNHYQRIS